jgi:hypothetical protein
MGSNAHVAVAFKVMHNTRTTAHNSAHNTTHDMDLAFRLSLWADGEVHQSLSADEIVYLTVAYVHSSLSPRVMFISHF